MTFEVDRALSINQSTGCWGSMPRSCFLWADFFSTLSIPPKKKKRKKVKNGTERNGKRTGTQILQANKQKQKVQNKQRTKNSKWNQKYGYETFLCVWVRGWVFANRQPNHIIMLLSRGVSIHLYILSLSLSLSLSREKSSGRAQDIKIESSLQQSHYHKVSKNLPPKVHQFHLFWFICLQLQV